MTKCGRSPRTQGQDEQGRALAKAPDSGLLRRAHVGQDGLEVGAVESQRLKGSSRGRIDDRCDREKLGRKDPAWPTRAP